MGDLRSPLGRRLVLGLSTILALVTLALPLPVEARVANVVDIPGWSPPPSTDVVDEGFAAEDGTLPPVTHPPAPDAPAEATPPPPEPDACADALAWVEGAGLGLPPGVEYRCPSTQFPHQGAACWNGSPCRGTGFIAINMDLLQGTSTEYLRHVVAHEVCHIIDFQATGRTTETGADACAAAHGAPA